MRQIHVLSLIFLTAVSLLLSSLFVATSGALLAQEPTQHPCGDGVCNQAEQRNPDLCPQDCPDIGLPRMPTTPEEREFLPDVTAVQTWQQIAVISERENFAPSVVPLYEGGYRIYWNVPSQRSIGSAYSLDGLTWTAEEDIQLPPDPDSEVDCVASHPWVVQMDGGYRMYYQTDANLCREGDFTVPEYRVASAFSTDGLVFEREGIRIDIGDETGLWGAAHGRVLQLADGTYRMFFSANFIGKSGPADILGATSSDGLTWTLDDEPILERGHDPTVVQIGDTISIYTTFLRGNLIILDSPDGYTFTPISWIEFYDENGTQIEEFGDIDIMLTPNGALYIYGSGKGAQGLGVFRREESR